MKFRLGKPQDAHRLAEIRSNIKDVNDRGVFVLMGGAFLRKYYRLALEDINTIFVCAEDETGNVVGYSFNILDSAAHNKFIYNHKFGLMFSALGTLIRKPSLLGDLMKRYKSLKNNDGEYVTASGVRSAFWGWDPEFPDAIGSMELNNAIARVTLGLGYKELHYEIDAENKKVVKYNLLVGAKIDKEINLSDGRKRYLMHISLEKKRRNKKTKTP